MSFYKDFRHKVFFLLNTAVMEKVFFFCFCCCVNCFQYTFFSKFGLHAHTLTKAQTLRGMHRKWTAVNSCTACRSYVTYRLVTLMHTYAHINTHMHYTNTVMRVELRRYALVRLNVCHSMQITNVTKCQLVAARSNSCLSIPYLPLTLPIAQQVQMSIRTQQ